MRFKETQRFRQPWIWLLVILTALPIYWPLFRQADSSPKGLSVVLLILHLLIVVLLLLTRLTVELDKRNLSYRFFPFHLKKKRFALSRIRSASIREFYPLKEKSFFGIHASTSSKSYHIKGNWGLQLEFTSGRFLLLGTQRPEELKKVLSELHIPEE
ncbi:MAG: hypothetical protein GXY94_11800 [Bacteroidales bacterium]|jgi:hypothetical protein|nr:hypothetical protein [Bacteroidales bacterium]